MLFTTIYYSIDEEGNRITFCGTDIEADTYEDAVDYIHANHLYHLHIDGFRGAPVGWKAPIEKPEPVSTDSGEFVCLPFVFFRVVNLRLRLANTPCAPSSKRVSA